MMPIYSAYYRWIDSGRETALAAALPDENRWHGKRFWGPIVESKLVHYDFGTLRVDRLERYCQGDWIEDEPPGLCEYRYRYALVPGSLWSHPERDRRIIQSFRPADLVKRLRNEGWEQPVDLALDGSVERLRAVFARHTDIVAFYRPEVTFREASSAKCPKLAVAIDKLAAPAIAATPRSLPSPESHFPIHGAQTQIRWTVATSNGSTFILDGAEALAETLKPIWDAVEECAPTPEAEAKAN